MYSLWTRIAMEIEVPRLPSSLPTRTAVNHLHCNTGVAEFGQCVKQQLCILSVVSTLSSAFLFLASQIHSLSHFYHSLSLALLQSCFI